MDRLKSFIASTLVVDVNQRPDANECVFLLIDLLYNIPQKGIERTNELFSRARELFLDELSYLDSDNTLLCESIVCTLANLFCFVCLQTANSTLHTT